jgi:hypothetical protein
VTAFEWTQVELSCNDPRCCEWFEGKRGLRPSSGETRAQVRKRAAKEGWTHVRSKFRGGSDRDFCPLHKPGGQTEAARAAGTEGNDDA